jgi:YD repeat-containing protein
VKRFAHPDKPDVDTISPFIGMYVGKPDFFKDFETDLIRLKDGRIWHFSKQGDLIAIEVGALATVYERDGEGQVTRIVALQGGALAAQITMEYDGEGRLAKVTGVDLVHKDALPVEVVYSYNEEGRLAGLEEAFYTKDKRGRSTHSEEKGGRVGYEYTGPWVSSINWRDASADKSESVTLASYQYNENGQLVSEQRGKDRRAYFIVATRDGLEARVANGGNGDTEVRTQYDNRMRPVKSFAADGTTTEWKYGPDGKVKSTTTAPDGRAVSVTDSADGRERILQAKGEPKVRILYDDGGRMVSMEQNSRTLLSQQWRPDGQLARIETVGSTADLQYGDNAFLESIMLRPPTRESRLTEWQQTNVDRFGRPVAVKDCTGLDLQMGYDAKGNLSRLVQKTPDGNLGFNIERDGEGRVEKMVSSWGTTGYSYSDKGELKAVTTQRNGQTASVELSGGRIAKVAGFDGGTTEYSYFDKGELEGLLRHVECPNRLELENSYDKQGRLEAVTVGEIRKVKLEYDQWNRVVGYIWEDL